jgi:hypothetical protein
MKREEEIKKQALRYGEPEYLLQTPNILGTQGYIQGAKWADKTMIEKACKWLESNTNPVFYSGNGWTTEEFIDNFKKAMKE